MQWRRVNLVWLKSSHAARWAAVVAGVVFLISSGVYTASLWRGLPGDEAIGRIGEMDQATVVFDDRDQPVFTLFREQRIETPLSQMSPYLTKAIVAVEDQRFFEHGGYDLVRIFAAALTNLRLARAAQGGSTITQQLARQSFLTTEKTIHRKLQELILAERIERRYSKAQILEMYLNKVYFGDGLYGAEAASRGYFAKHASDLSISEAALLAGLVKSPSTYAPTVNLDRSVARRNVVLQAMRDNGALDHDAWTAARASKVVLHDGLRAEEPHGQYFKEQVRRELVDRFGWQRVYQGGLRVYSTINMPMQMSAESAVAASLKALDEQRAALLKRRKAAAKSKGKPVAPTETEHDVADQLQAALVALDPTTGQVRAMVGGRNFSESPFNRAIQAKRQPGSAFKPFVYAAALEAGYTPASIIDRLNDPIPTLQGAWTPEDEHSTVDAMSLRAGLRTSSNRAAVRLLQQVGIPRTVEYAKEMGVGDVPSVPSLALGSGEVTLETLTAAYGAFANHGLVSTPFLVRRVEERDGHVLFETDAKSSRAVSESTAFLMSTMMADVINAGTAAGARRLGFTLPAAGKTGTTNDFNDAWFVGFTPRIVAGVWVGFDQPRTILPNGFAAQVAVPLWTSFMKSATRDDKPEWFAPPTGVTTAVVCRLSGKLAGEGCDDTYTEYFARGTEPTMVCDLHPVHGILGKIAGLFFGGGEKPPPPHMPPPAPPADRVADAAAPSPEPLPPPPPQPEKKRGFWAKVFGRK